MERPAAQGSSSSSSRARWPGLLPRRHRNGGPGLAPELTGTAPRAAASGADSPELEPLRLLLAGTEPDVSRLLLDVSRAAGSLARRVALGRSVQEAEKEMNSHKVAWLKGKVLYDEIQDILRDLKIRIGDNVATSEDKCFFQTLEQCLFVTESIRLLGTDSDREDKPPLLRLHRDDLRQLLPNAQEQNKMKDRLAQELEEKLSQKCLSLFYYFSPEKAQGEAESEALRLAKACRLHELVRAEQQAVQGGAARLCELRTAHDAHVSTHLKTLQASKAVLEKMLQDHRLSRQAQSDAVKVAYLQAKHKTMYLKLQLEELNILCDTYTPDKVQAHKIINRVPRCRRRELKAAMATEKKEQARVSGELATYGTLGPDFERLVQEYTQLRDAIDNKKWALREFRKNAA
ncbi:HAUS augmin-like complex subunit 4 isoform X1 [Lethenteron reissneri]|uniref:HAUS augmin-like complex subunit 4 isoform X1 n=1 Tax=Lethenteron reissneri TaxID=7753 RepID=UPI002AB760AF|nr:HAUS augmin-like complex subunit 4 isoform X1 [Lethenteron reissneri]